MADKDNTISNLNKKEKRALASKLLGIPTVATTPSATSQSSTANKVSTGQQALWFMHKLLPESPANHVAFPVRIYAPVDVDIMERTWEMLVQRHASLRMVFSEKRGELHQQPGDELLSFTLHEPGDLSEQALQKVIEDVYKTPFDLQNGPITRIHLFKISDQEYLLLPVIHHIALDGHSIVLLLKQSSQLYVDLVNGIENRYIAPPIDYSDFVTWQHNKLSEQKIQKSWAYWQEKLQDELPVLDLPADFPRSPVKAENGGSFHFKLDQLLVVRLQAIAKESGVTLYMLLLAIYQVLLHRYSQQETVMVGSPISVRPRDDFHQVVGYFVNLITFRANFSGDPDFQTFLRQARQEIVAAFSHMEIPYGSLVERLQLSRRDNVNPIFQAVFNFQSFSSDRQLEGLFIPLDDKSPAQWGGLPASGYSMSQQHGQFELLFDLFEARGSIYGAIKYDTDRFTEPRIARMQSHFVALIEGVLEQPQQRLSRLPLLSQQERQQIMAWNNTQTDYPHDALIHQLFEQQAAQRGDAIALVFEDQTLSYAVLNQQANQLAHYLIEQGVQPDTLVGLCLERSLDMVVALLAVLKAGGAYVPLDPTYPEQRLAYMLADSAPQVLLTQAALFQQMRRLIPDADSCLLVVMDAVPWVDSDWGSAPVTNPDPYASSLTSRHLAYVIYTSGSTGQPKGVMVEHRSVVRLVCNTNYIEINSENTIAQASNVSFDAATFEIWGALINGAKVAIIEKELSLSSILFSNFLQTHKVDILWLTAGLFNQIVKEIPNAFKTLRYVIVGGEALNPVWLRKVLEHGKPQFLLNAYGPTEGTTFSSYFLIKEIAVDTVNVPIGSAISNTQLYVLDSRQQLSPIGIPGELYISGAGLARGYLNRPELTAERFVPNPFAGNDDESIARLYKTGDLVRWSADGNLEFLDRIDHQIKLRGFRIELGEIEAQLTELPGVREAVVMVREYRPGDRRLVAYWVADKTVDPATAREHLSAVLPEYMIPAAYVALDALPLTPNGKLDRQALPAPDDEALSHHYYEAPKGEIEITVAQIWSELLGVERVGRHDQFFELGGHSLLAAQLLSQLRQQLGVEVPLSAVFNHPELAALTKAIVASAQTTLSAITPADRGQPLPLSWAQQRLWFIDQMDPQASVAYHIPGGSRLRGRLNVSALQAAFDRIIARHEVLRTRFVLTDGQPFQVIDDPFPFALQQQDVASMTAEDIRQCCIDEATAPFALDTGPLIRGRLLCVSADEHLLLITMHHIVADGWSIGRLTDELSQLYNAFDSGEDDPLPPLTIQYADYACWQQQWLSGPMLQAQLNYWVEHLQGAPELLTLLTDRPRPERQDYRGGRIPVALDQATTEALKALGQSRGATLYMTVLSAWAALLSCLSGQDEVVIGSPIANRIRREIEPLIGFFVNTQALRVDMKGNPDIAALIDQVKHSAIAAQEHQNVPFEQLVDTLNPTRSLAHSPIFQVVLAWQNNPQTPLVMGDLTIEPLDSHYQPAKFDLTLTLEETDAGLMGSLDYATALFDEATVQRHWGYLCRLLKGMVNNDQQAVSAIDLLDDNERRLVLDTFNDTSWNCPRDVLIHQLFEQQVVQRGQAIAVVFGEQTLSYEELNQRANQLAHYLREQGVGPDTLVGLCLERSLETVISIVAVLKAGGAYVPLDSTYPQERLAWMLEDSKPQLLLTQAALSEQLRLLIAETHLLIVLDAVPWADSPWSNMPRSNPDPQSIGLNAQNLAYVIYTSGSTGQPKGVMTSHNNVHHLFASSEDIYHFDSSDVWTLFHSYAFDFSVWELWGALLYGGRLVVLPYWITRSPEQFYEELCKHNVTVLNQTPSSFRQLTQAALDSRCLANVLRYVIFGGEALEVNAVKLWFERFGADRPVLVNMYGITETTVHVTHHKLTYNDIDGDIIPIGRQLNHLQVYILNRHQQPLPIGVPGELYVGGTGLARGYLNRPELTKECFIDHPFSGQPDARLYRSGDLGRYRQDGSLEHLGRVDHQVKLRGFRIELGEIEVQLSRLPGVHEVVVIAREDRVGDPRLVAYWVVDVDVDPIQAREYLGKILPDYMVPTAYVALEALPLTSNGKLDRQALPAPGDDALLQRHYEAPKGEIEAAVARIWCELLGVERVGRHDQFFELGGHSLLAVQLVERLRQQEWFIDIRTLFNSPGLAQVAEAIVDTLEQGRQEITVPPNRIPAGCTNITASMLPLVTLDSKQIDNIVTSVPGGAANIQDIYPLTPMQEGILFHHLLQAEGDAYVTFALLSFDTRDHLKAFNDALNIVIERHDTLRTAVLWENLDKPVQVVWREARFELEIIDNGADGDAQEQLQARRDPQHSRLDIRQAPLLRGLAAYDAASQCWLLQFLFHHVIEDNTTLNVLMEEIALIQQGRLDELPAPTPFRNFVAQTRLGISEEEHKTFFNAMLGDVDEPTAPFGLLDIQGDGANIQEASLAVNPDLARRLRQQAKIHGVSTASLCHLAWAQVLSKATGRDDVVFGTVLFGRFQGGEAADRALGLFINTLPIRIQLGEQRVKDCVQQTHQTLAELFFHEHASLVLAQRCSGLTGTTPLFSALLNYRQNVPEDTTTATGLEGVRLLKAEERTNYPFTIAVDDLGKGFRLTAQVNESVSAEQVCALMHTALGSLVSALAEKAFLPMHALAVLPDCERQLVLETFNNSARDYPRDALIHQLFEQQAAHSGEAMALVFEDQALSYAELNYQTNQLAHYLMAQGIGPDTLVGLFVERSLDMVIGILAILKAGGAYVPLDPNYPQERLAWMLIDSAPQVLLTQAALSGRLHALTANADALPPIVIDATPWAESAWGKLLKSNPNPQSSGLNVQHLAYVIYTSGSTGRPKGVMVPHLGLANLAISQCQQFQIDDSSRVLQFATFGFDAAVSEVFTTLSRGACLYLPPSSATLAGQTLSEFINQHQITHATLPPVALRSIPAAITMPSLKTLVTAGEASSKQIVQRWGPGRLLLNAYGPTETTVCATIYHCHVEEEAHTPPIGWPIANTQIYLLDAHLQPVPVGVAGEIYIGGVGIARGYLNRPDLTAERFLINPFAGADDNNKLYKTGDLGRWRADGAVEYLGRNDFQVKLRGFRIELGEIEAQLMRLPSVREAVVIAREDRSGDPRLVAYWVADVDINPAEVREHLSSVLPDYMIPAAYVTLNNLPLTPNGKLDRKALPDPGDDALLQRHYEAPEGEIETMVAQLWQELLGVERVGRYDQFFELGGHSLLAVQFIERLRQRDWFIDIRTLFKSSGLAQVAQAIADTSKQGRREIIVPPNRIPAGCSTITPSMLPLVTLDSKQIATIAAAVPGGAANIQDIYPLAPLQEGILFHHLLQTEGDTYLTWALLAFDSRERLQGFTDTLNQVIVRHDTLRTVILWENLEDPVQVVWREAHFEPEIIDIVDSDVQAQLWAHGNPQHFRLDIRQAPLLHGFAAYDATGQRWLLLFLFHHLVMDHTTLEVLTEEVALIQQGRQHQLPAPVPFRNFVAQARLGLSEDKHKAFFQQLLGDVDEPTAPFGLLDVQGDSTNIQQATLAVDTDLAQHLRQQAKAHGVSTASLFHLAWAQVLSKTTGRDDVIFGTVLFGRFQGGTGSDRALGLFTNTLPVRICLGDRSVKDCLQQTHQNLTELLFHEHASLVLAQRCSNLAASTPLFSALLNYRYSLSTDEAVSGLEGIQILDGEERTNYPFTLSVDDLGQGFQLTAQIDDTVSADRVCALMCASLDSLVTALDENASIPIYDLTVLPDSERQMVLETFNDTTQDYPQDVLIHQLFEVQAEQCPDSIALVFEDQRLSYAELNRRTNQLAHYLIEQGVEPDCLVGLCMDRSLELVVALLAILKAGAAYVPLDPEYPQERLRYMLTDSAPRLLLTQEALLEQVSLLTDACSIIVLDAALWANSDWSHAPVTNPDAHILGLTSHHLAYVIYTSGSTGKPKGVCVEHRQLNNFIHSMGREPGLTAEDRLLAVTSLSFDIHTLELFLPLVTGAQLVVAPSIILTDATTLKAHIDRYEITVIQATPSTWSLFKAQGDLEGRVLKVLCGGEAMPFALQSWFEEQPSLTVWNMYGPTETSVWSTTKCLNSTINGLIGKPINNTQVYVLDKQLQPVPLGVTGEIYIGGAGVTRGYLNRSELTVELFLDNPFADQAMLSRGWNRIYRTGDYGCWRSDGSLDCQGRVDQQVKIRGYRIESGEIEAQLTRLPGVREVVVIVREDRAGDPRLVVYWVTDDIIDPARAREHLGGVLPDYMVPAAYVTLDALPLTPNGKLDRKALPAPDDDALLQRHYEPPEGEIEITLAQIWRELLGVERVGRQDQFFELGGHSLLAVQLVERLRQQDWLIDIRTLFNFPGLVQMAQAIADTRRQGRREIIVPPNRIPEGCTTITPEMLPLVTLDSAQIASIVAATPGGAANIQDIYPLAPLQEGVLFHHLLESEGDTYLTYSLLAFDSESRLQAFTDALNAVIARHDILRTALLWEGLDDAVQVVWRQARFEPEIIDCVDGNVQAQLQAHGDPRHIRLDIRQAPLLHGFVAYDAKEQRWLLQFLFHHLIMDHTTLDILLEEITLIQQGRHTELTVPVPFRNFVAQTRLGLSEQDHEVFFQKMLGDVDEATAPFGLLDVQGDGASIQEASLVLDNDLAQRLRQQAKAHGVSIASLYHLAWAQVLSKATGRDDVVFGTVLFGRLQGGAGADRALGLFVNTLPVRVYLGDHTVESCVKRTYQTLTELLFHEHASLALAQRCNALAATTPLFSALFNYRYSMPVDATTSPGLEGVSVLATEERTNYPLTLSVDDLGEQFRLTIHVADSVSAAGVCALMHTALDSLVSALVEQPLLPIHALTVLPDSERRLVLETFNDTVQDYPREVLIHQLFEAQVEQRGEAMALVFEDQTLSYTELNQRANQLAHYLLEQGIGPDALVGLCMERSLEMVIGILAVLKAGGAYVPLDPTYPQKRLSYMLDDSAPRILLTQAALYERLCTLIQTNIPETNACRIIVLDAVPWATSAWVTASRTNPDPRVVNLTAKHLAYVIYTSGSTGRPKGVMVAHCGLTNLVISQNRQFQIDANSRVLQFASFSFDAAVSEVFTALSQGACLYLPSSAETLAGQTLSDFINHHQITHATLPPVALMSIPAELSMPSLKTLVTAGEASNERIVQRWGSDHLLLNAYGPTEATVCATIYPCRLEEQYAPPIGSPIANTQIYLLDSHLQPVPVGVKGEIYIGGVGVARGYLNRPELTAERFLPNPFIKTGDDSTARLYKTGDLGRWRADGAVEYVGRNDFQIKLRGFRIEPGEIEARLAQLPGVREAAVVGRGDRAGDQRLVAYWAADADIDLAQAREHLSKLSLGQMTPTTDATGDLQDNQASHISQWQNLYENSYADLPDGTTPQFNISGWNSSYTREPIAASEMLEWVENTVVRIRLLQPRRILELGCGSGLLLWRLAGECEHYVGADFSSTVLTQLQRDLDTHTDWSHVQLYHREALDFSGFADQAFDVVILNSVVQYFPDTRYLTQVLNQAVAVLRPGGQIFVGDVRNYQWLRSAHAAFCYYRAAKSMTRLELKEQIRKDTLFEEELTLSPGYFHQFTQASRHLQQAQVLLKHGKAENELNQFRYDVILTTRQLEETVQTPPTLDVNYQSLSVVDIEQALIETTSQATEVPPLIGVLNIKNKRIQKPFAILDWVDSTDPLDLGHLQDALTDTLHDGIDPVDLIEMARAHGFKVAFTPAQQVRCFNAWFYHPTVDLFTLDLSSFITPIIGENLANTPQKGTLMRGFEVSLRGQLEQLLPQYMVPSVFVPMEKLPLTPNGKLDRKALPAPDDKIFLQRRYEAPEGEIEITVARIWCQLLGVEQVGRHDQFFELGGHSLLAIRMIDLLRAQGLEVEVRRLLDTPVLRDFSQYLQHVTTARHSRYVVPIRVGDSSNNSVFFIHQPGGDIFIYQHLANCLENDISIYGVQANRQTIFEDTTLEQLAARYIGEIRQVQPDGPYRLAGWSAGGSIAYEMACQLIANGQEVVFVGLIDSICKQSSESSVDEEDFNAFINTPDYKKHLLARYVHSSHPEVDELALQSQFDAEDIDSSITLCHQQGWLPDTFTVEDFQCWQKLYVHNVQLALSYRPKALVTGSAKHTPVVLFSADSENEPKMDPSNGWSALLGETLTIRPVPGTHRSIMDQPEQIKILGTQFSAALQQAEEVPVVTQGLQKVAFTLRSAGKGAPVAFFIPGAGANASSLLALTEALGDELHMVALQTPGLNGQSIPLRSVEVAARAYLREIRHIAPLGPYRLLGHSFGGWIAFEIARQLASLGEQVAPVIIIDSDVPGRVTQLSRIQTLAKLIRLMQMDTGKPLHPDFAQLGALDESSQIKYLHQAVISSGIMPTRTTLETLENIIRVFEIQINTDYLPHDRYSGSLLLFKAEDEWDEDNNNPSNWSDYAEDMREIIVPGSNHMSIIKSPSVDLVVSELMNAWNLLECYAEVREARKKFL